MADLHRTQFIIACCSRVLQALTTYGIYERFLEASDNASYTVAADCGRLFRAFLTVPA